MQRQRPARVLLSPDVARRGVDRAAKLETRAREAVYGAFGGMNQTSAGFTKPERRKKQFSEPAAHDDPSTRSSQALELEDTAGAGIRVKAPPSSIAFMEKKPKDPTKGKFGGEVFKHLKMQRALAAIPYDQRSEIKDALDRIQSFDDFSLLPTILEAIPKTVLPNMETLKPSPIQKLAIPAILGQEGIRRKVKPKDLDKEKIQLEQFLLAAETGSGKTLAYTLPIVDAIKRLERLDDAVAAFELKKRQSESTKGRYELDGPEITNAHPTAGKPAALILLPTNELVNQVGAVIKSLSHGVKFRAASINSALTPTVIRSRLFNPGGLDILVSTPHLLTSLLDTDPYILTRVSHLVIDEADSLFDRSFTPLTTKIMDLCKPTLQKLILCSATIPRSLDGYLQTHFPRIQRLTTPNLHAVPRRVQLGVVDIQQPPYVGNRSLACADIIWQLGRAVRFRSEPDRPQEQEFDPFELRRIIVFVNERETAPELATYLRTKGIDATALSRDSEDRKASKELLAEFCRNDYVKPTSEERALVLKVPAPTNLLPIHKKGTKFLGGVKVLVMTDLGSRGIDTLPVRTVVLYDVPGSTIDFLHRLGRCGRMGRRGRGIILVGKDDNKAVVREIRESMFRGQALI